MFLAFQYPVEIPGVNNTYFLKAAVNAIRRHRGQSELDAMDFLALVREKLGVLHMDESLLKRGVNVGFSGGEKKRNEIFQLALMEPKLAILDETDSGLDIDALKDVASGVNALRGPERSTILVTHYQRMLDHIVPDRVHVLSGGRIAASGGRRAGPGARIQGIRLGARGGGGRRMNDATAATARYVDAFAARESALPGHHLAWLRGVRRAGIDAFSRTGFPTPRNEHWKYTNVSPIETALVRPRRALLPRRARRRSGRIRAERLRLALPRLRRRARRPRALRRPCPAAGVRIEDFTRVVEHDSGFLEGRLGRIVSPEKTAFTALNAAFMDAGAVVRVAPDTDAGAPVHLVFVSGSPECERAYCPRIVIAAGAGSRIAVVEHFVGLDDTVYLDNVVTEIEVAEGASVEHHKVQRASAGAYHVAALQAEARGGSLVPAPGRCRSEPGSRGTTST